MCTGLEILLNTLNPSEKEEQYSKESTCMCITSIFSNN